MSFKDNLIRLRKEAGFTKAKDFADKIGIKYSTYMGYENKNAWPTSEENLKKIAEGLNVSIDKLLDYKPKEPDNLQKAKGIAKKCGVKFHVTKAGFIQIDSIQRRKAPPNFSLPGEAFQAFVFRTLDILMPELNTFRSKMQNLYNDYEQERFSEVFRQILVNYYYVVAKEVAPFRRETRVFDSPDVYDKYYDIPSEEDFVDKLSKIAKSTSKETDIQGGKA